MNQPKCGLKHSQLSPRNAAGLTGPGTLRSAPPNCGSPASRLASAASRAEDAEKMVVLWENHRKTMGKWWFYHVLPSGKLT